MADEPTPETADSTAEAAPALGLRGRIASLLTWARASKLRMIIVGSVFAILFGGTFATWSHLARLAVNQQELKTIEMALAALDSGKFEEAKSIIGEIQEQENAEPEFGSALFVLGAVKGAQAELEYSQDRQRAIHLVAARYLQKARELDIPKGRENQARYLIGRSLVLGNQHKAGIKSLESVLDDPSLPISEIHALLTQAHLSTAEPDLEVALQHNQSVLDDATFDSQRKCAAYITQADILGQMGRLDDAHKHLQMASDLITKDDTSLQARIKSVAGQLAIIRAEQLPTDDSQRITLTDQALADLREAQQLDSLNSELTRHAMYWIGKCYEVRNNPAAAIKKYDQLSKSYGETPESIAAMLAKANLARAAGNTQQALAGYRTVLSAVGDPVTYVNRLLPASALRKQLQRAYNAYAEAGQFEEAMALLEAFDPMFDLTQITQLRAQVQEKWAEENFSAAEQATHWEAAEYRKQGRYHHRATGAAYELLSQLRYATPDFINDLWLAAEHYYQGQSYSQAERCLGEYLHHEAKDKQALALLRLGQSQLALQKNEQAVETLIECIELYPGDGVVYQARLECAHAYIQLSQGDLAQKLLLANINGGDLGPTASEWRDSLFLLGDYYHNTSQYYKAIYSLDNVVRRVENLEPVILREIDKKQALYARYTIARSYHRASEEPAQLANQAKTESERQKNRLLRDENLAAALEKYLQVQQMLTLQGQVDSNELERTLLRNCYMMQGSVLFQLKRYEEARKAYANISTVYQDEPFVLESFVHIANCYRRLNKPIKAKGTIEQAKLVLERFPANTDFKLATNFSRQAWNLLLDEMGEW